jgi:hypothetical protein
VEFSYQKPFKADQTIAVIDLQVLRRLGIAYGSSTDDLGFRHLNKTNGTGTLFATKHHILVLGCFLLAAFSVSYRSSNLRRYSSL